MVVIKTKSAKETKDTAKFLLRSVRSTKRKPKNGPLILALEGNLGSGKTTFAQGAARSLGIKEKVVSPTFVLLKIYELATKSDFKYLIHVDCYRLGSYKDLLHLGFEKMLKDKDAVLIIEWASRIGKILPRGTLRIKFRHGAQTNTRFIEFKN